MIMETIMTKEELKEGLKAVFNEELKGELVNLKKELYINNKSKGMLDALQEKIVSRKLLVFLTATALLAWSGLDADTWGMIAICYIGGQSVIDVAKVWKGA